MYQTGSNLRLSQLHPLRPIHTDQSQLRFRERHTHTDRQNHQSKKPPDHRSVRLEQESMFRLNVKECQIEVREEEMYIVNHTNNERVSQSSQPYM